MFDILEARRDFPILKPNELKKTMIYFDNAATTQKPQPVIDTMVKFYAEQNANIYRGVYHLSRQASALYDNARESARRFINAQYSQEIVFTKSVTEAINLVAGSYGEAFLKPGGNIITTELEHHSNLLPWQNTCRKQGGQLRLIPIESNGNLNLAAFEKLIDERTALVAVTAAANSIGVRPPLKELIRMAHQYRIPVLVDGAQSVAHEPVDVQTLDCDFFCFSGHKLYGPTGTGVLYGKKQYLEAMPPYQYGGDMIDRIGPDENSYQKLPCKFEAGTPNIAGVLGLEAAIRYLEAVGMDKIGVYETELTNYAIGQLDKINGFRLIGARQNRAPLVSFVIAGMHHYDLSTLLDLYGIATRCGEHCAQLTMKKLKLEGTVRASFAFYNTKAEIDYFCDKLELIVKRYGGRR